MSFLRDYLRACGTSEVPPAFQQWCGIAALAAAAADHVWIQKGSEQVLPNLYVFLLGPSGIGKDGAINGALRLLEGVPGTRVLRWRGTAASLIDTLTPGKGGSPEDSKVLLVTPELAQSLRRGDIADDFIKTMTDLYVRGPMALYERTRTNGLHLVQGHCVNWLAGTTREWLRDCVTQDAVEGGFFGRVCAIQAAYDLDRRVPSPSLPADVDALRKGLREHLCAVAEQRGEMWLEPAAQSVLDDWYMTRPAPEDDLAIPVWRRQHTLVLKLSMLMALADSPARCTVAVGHVVAAQRLAAQAVGTHTTIAEYVAVTKESDGLRRVRDYVREAHVVSHSTLSRFGANVGVTKDKLRIITETLLDGGLMVRVPLPSGPGYAWAGKRSWEPEPEAGSDEEQEDT